MSEHTPSLPPLCALCGAPMIQVASVPILFECSAAFGRYQRALFDGAPEKFPEALSHLRESCEVRVDERRD